MNKLTVKINGMEYALKGEEKEEYLLKIASYVDKKLKNITDINPRLDTTSAAVLTAVNTIDEMFKQKQAYEEVAKEKEEFEKSEIAFHEEIKNLKKELDELKDMNKEMKFQNQSAKYKILDLQQKLMNSQIDVAKTKKQSFDMKSNPLNKKKPL